MWGEGDEGGQGARGAERGGKGGRKGGGGPCSRLDSSCRESCEGKGGEGKEVVGVGELEGEGHLEIFGFRNQPESWPRNVHMQQGAGLLGAGPLVAEDPRELVPTVGYGYGLGVGGRTFTTHSHFLPVRLGRRPHHPPRAQC